jgi:hypothetical protein
LAHSKCGRKYEISGVWIPSWSLFWLDEKKVFQLQLIKKLSRSFEIGYARARFGKRRNKRISFSPSIHIFPCSWKLSSHSPLTISNASLVGKVWETIANYY